MKSPVYTVHEVEDLGKLVNILRDTEHGGFPVVTPDNKFIGLITR